MEKIPVCIPEDLKKVTQLFAESGHECWLVGGAVRDGLCGRCSEDLDLATDATPKEMMKIFHRVIPTGIKHGTVTILMGCRQFETTTFRRDGKYTDGRRPDKVEFSHDILEDLARRDFTINSIAWDLIHHKILDPHNGQTDLKNRIIRAIGNPAERFREDSLRAIRACRFAAQLGFSIEEQTFALIKTALPAISSVSAERVREELKKILLTPKPSAAFRLFADSGLLEALFPELKACIGVKHNQHQDVFDYSLMVCDQMPQKNYPLRAAALLHGVGIPETKHNHHTGKNTACVYGSAGARIAESLLNRLKASNAEKKRIPRLVLHHEFGGTESWTDAQIRRFIADTGMDIMDDLLTLHSALSPDTDRNLRPRIAEQSDSPLSIKDLNINGRILSEQLELRPGPQIGIILNNLLNHVLEDPELNTESQLIALAKNQLN